MSHPGKQNIPTAPAPQPMHTEIAFPPKEYSQPIVNRMNFDHSHKATAMSIE